MPRLVFEPLGLAVDWAETESLFDAGRRAGVPIPTACVGRATCGLCRVKIEVGEEHLEPLGPDEKKHLGNTYFITRLRLSCRTRLRPGATPGEAPITVRLPDARKKITTVTKG